MLRSVNFRNFPGGPVVKILPSNAGAVGLTSGQEAKMLHIRPPKKKKYKCKAEAILQQIQ